MGDEREEREERHRFARRLEAFSDIVFGFALAQCAFALEIPKTARFRPADLENLVFFAITFSLVAVFWTMHYRVFRYAFAGRNVDIVLNFLLLASVALLPYALRLYTSYSQSILGSAAYAAELGAGFALLAVLEWRGLRAHESELSPRVRRNIRRSFVRHALVATVMVISLFLMIPFGLGARLVWMAAPIGGVVLRLMERARRRRGTSAVLAES